MLPSFSPLRRYGKAIKFLKEPTLSFRSDMVQLYHQKQYDILKNLYQILHVCITESNPFPFGFGFSFTLTEPDFGIFSNACLIILQLSNMSSHGILDRA